MTHLCCPTADCASHPAAGAQLVACPACGKPPQPSSLQGTVGFRIFTLEDVPHSLPEAVAVSLPGSRSGRSAIVNDLHLRILRLVADRNQRELNNHDAADHVPDAASAARREDLERTARRTRARGRSGASPTALPPPKPPVLTVASVYGVDSPAGVRLRMQRPRRRPEDLPLRG
jgi:hypothetical protein